jgi:hypothetical protein
LEGKFHTLSHDCELLFPLRIWKDSNSCPLCSAVGIECVSKILTNDDLDVACVVVLRATVIVKYLYDTCVTTYTLPVLYLNSVGEMVSTFSQASWYYIPKQLYVGL